MIVRTVLILTFVLGCASEDFITEPHPMTGSKNVLWKFDTTWEASKPIIYETRLYASAGNYLYVLDAATGKEIWRHGQRYASHSNPVPYNQRVYVGSNESENYVYALDAATGEMIWQTHVDFPISFVVLSEELGMVYSSSIVDEVCAMDMETGEVVWKYSTPGLSFRMFLVDDVLYVDRQSPATDEGPRTDALDAKTGQLLEDAPPPEKKSVRFEDLIYYKGKEGGFLIAEDAQTNQIRWQLEEEISGGIQVVDGVVYVGAFKGTLYALDAKTGQVLGQYRGERSYVASFTLSEDIAYVSYGWAFICAFRLNH